MKKKGFTLVELLAVIVVLAIITLIATPTILGVIEKAKKATFKDSVYGIIESADLYIATNLGVKNSEFICNGKKCYQEEQKLNFKGEVPESGTVIIENSKVRVSFLSNGTYCANGTREDLKISDDCTSLDETEPEVNDKKISYTSTINSVTIYFNDFAIDKESAIKEYEITLNNETKIVDFSKSNVTFQELKYDTEYEAKIKVINKNELETTVTMMTKTLAVNNPSIVLESTPEESINGYYINQTAKISYDSTNIESPRYYLKTTREGTSSVAVTQACGTGTTPSTCTSITSTTNLETNTWYEVSGNVNVTYNVTATPTDTIYAITYDGTNYSGATSGTINKIDSTSLTVGTVSFSNIDCHTFTANLTITDQNSGLSKIVWYYKLSSDSVYSSIIDTYASSIGTINGQRLFTFTDYNKTYNVYARVYDAVGNYKDTAVANATTTAPVATIGSTGYSSLTKAITGAGSSTATITMQNNTSEAVTFSQGNITLALNSKTITDAITNTGGILTISSSGNINTSSITNAPCVYATGGTVKITGGTFKANGDCIYVKGATLNITGGIFSGVNYAGIKVLTGTANITGGTFKGGTSSPGLVSLGGTTNITNTNNVSISSSGAGILVQG